MEAGFSPLWSSGGFQEIEEKFEFGSYLIIFSLNFHFYISIIFIHFFITYFIEFSFNHRGLGRGGGGSSFPHFPHYLARSGAYIGKIIRTLGHNLKVGACKTHYTNLCVSMYCRHNKYMCNILSRLSRCFFYSYRKL